MSFNNQTVASISSDDVSVAVPLTLRAKVIACVGKRVVRLVGWCLTTEKHHRFLIAALLVLPLALQGAMPPVLSTWTWSNTLVWWAVACGPLGLSLFVMWRFNGWWWDIVHTVVFRLDPDVRTLLTDNCYGRFRNMVIFFSVCVIVSVVLYLNNNPTDAASILFTLFLSFLYGMARILAISYTLMLHEFVCRVCKKAVHLVLEGRCDESLHRKLVWTRNVTFVSIWVGVCTETAMLVLWQNAVVEFPPIPVSLMTFTLYNRNYYGNAAQLSSGFMLIRLIIPALVLFRASVLTVYCAREKRIAVQSSVSVGSSPTASRWLAADDYCFTIPIFQKYPFIFPVLSMAAWLVVLVCVYQVPAQ